MDGDNRVTGIDALLILRAFVGLDPISPRMATHGIITVIGIDGKPHPGSQLSLVDALLVLQKATGIITWDTTEMPPANLPPTANAGSNQSITLPFGQTTTTVVLHGTATDSDGTIAGYSWSGTPKPADVQNPAIILGAGSYIFSLIATDNQGAQSAASTVTITVNAAQPPVNQPPTANAGSNQTITMPSGQTTISVTLHGTATDNDGTIAGYSWSGTPKPADVQNPAVTLGAGNYTFSLTATDNQGAHSAASTVTITVKAAQAPANLAPTANAGSNQTLTLLPGQSATSVTLHGTATDSDGTIAGYSWSGTPKPADVQNPVITLGVGSYTFSLVATDNQGAQSAASTVTVTVNAAQAPANLAPTANAGSNQTVTLTAGETTRTITLSGSGSDSDGTIASYFWSGIPSPSPATAATATVSLGAGTYTYSLIVTDNQGAQSAASTVTITVNAAPVPANQPPIANAGSNQTLTLPPGQTTATVTLHGTATDNDGTIAGYSWSGTPKPADVQNPVITLGAGSYTFSLVATDNQGAQSTASTVTITVTPSLDRPPVIITQSLPAGRVGTAYTASVSASDPDGDQLSFTLDQGPAGMTINSSSGIITWQPAVEQVGTVQATVTVNDGKGGGDSRTFTIAVPDTIAPTISLSAPPVKVMQGSTNTITAVAADNKAVKSVTFLVNGVQQAVVAASPYQFSLNTSQAPGTVLIVRAVAEDTSGNTAAAEAGITVYVENANNHAPQLGALDAAYTVAEGATLTIPVTGADVDGDSLTYSVTTTPSPLANSSFSANTFTFTPGYTQAGSYSITFRAVDPFGLTDQKTIQITVTDVNRPPVLTTRALPDGRIDFPYSTTMAGSDPDNDPLTFSLTQGPAGMVINAATGVLTWKPGIGDIGSYTVSVAVSDGKGGSDSRQFTLLVPDSIPPTVSLSAPREAIPGATFKVTAAATDNIAVTQVTITVAGQPAVNLAAAPYELQVTLPDALPVGSSIVISAIATDAAGNSSTATSPVKIAAVPDIIKPVVTITAPATVFPGNLVVVSAVATDNQGVASLDFSVDGAVIGTAGSSLPRVSYTVPANTASGTTITFSVTATDFSGNSATAQTQSMVVAAPAIPDTTPPAVSLTAPSSIVVGSLLPVTISAGDDTGIATVELLLAHNRVAYFTTAVDQTVNLPLPDGASAGMEMVVELRAFDISGNTAAASTSVTVVARGQGVLTGAVYDDSTGLPLPGATVRLALGGQTEQSVTTDSRGRYSLVSDEGTGVLTATRTGYNRVDRSPAVVGTNSGRRVADIRLTPLPASAAALSAVLGGTATAPFSPAKGGIASALKEAGIIPVSTDGITVALPSGALSADQNMTLFQVSAQGLQSSLPSGWSPVAAFDLHPHGIAFAAPAAARVPNLLRLSAAAGTVVARWDEANSVWLMAGTATVAADGSTLGINIPSSGQYVFLVPDAGSTQTTPAEGASLPAVPLLPLGQNLQAQVTPQPKLIFYKPGVSSAVGSRVAAAAPLTSGTHVRATIAEDYGFYSGDRIIAEPYAQDILLYTFGLPSGALLADYPVSPGQDFTGQLLEKGIISVTTTVPPTNADAVTVIGPQGGAATTAGGEALIIPAGAVNRTVPVVIKPFNLAESGLTVPSGFTLMGGVTFTLPGATLQAAAALSLPLPAGFTATGDLLLVRPLAIGGSTHLEIIGRGVVNSGRLLSTREVPGSTTALFPGITGEGSVFLLQSAVPFGYAGGSVTGTDNAPFSGALVSSPMPLVATSSFSGSFVTAVIPGTFTLTALDTQKMDKGTASGTVAAGTYTPLNLSLAIEPPTVAAVIPAHNAGNVALADPVVIKLSEPVVSAGPANVQLSSSTGSVNGSVELSVDGSTVTFRHPDLFTSNTLYTVTVTGLVDRSGTIMAVPFTSVFTSINTAPPVAPPAGSVTATIPSADGRSTVSGTQGSAGLHDTVVIVNMTTGARNPVVVDPNGSFSTIIDATKKDRLQLEITSPAGSTITVPLPRFQQVNTDGSIASAVGPEGGRVVLADGLTFDVPAGAFTDVETVQFKSLTQAELGIPDMPGTGYKFAAGFDMQASKKPSKYINFSIPAPAGFDGSVPGIIAKMETATGGPIYSVVDTAKLIDGRFATSSPPCPGIVDISGRYFGMILNDPSTSAPDKVNRIKQYGMTVLHMSVPEVKSVVIQPFADTSGVSDSFTALSGLNSMFVPITVNTLQEPASIFMAKVSKSTSVADVQQSLLETQCGTGGCGSGYTDICIPVPANQNLTIAIRSASTGTVIGTHPLTSTGPGTTQQMNFSITDPFDKNRPQILLTSWDGLNVLENGTPIVIYFTEAVMLGATNPVYLTTTGATPVTINGKAHLDSSGRALQFVPDTPLPLGETFTLHLADVQDKSGNRYLDDPTAGPRTFKTFKPYLLWQNAADLLTQTKISGDLHATTSLPNNISFKNIDFKTLLPEETLGGKWQTTLIGVGNDATDAIPMQFLTIDYSNPMFPKALALSRAGYGRRYGAVTLLPDFYLKPRTLPPGSAPYTSAVQLLSQRVLHYVDSNPARKICIDPASTTGSALLTKWESANCPYGAGCSTKAGGCGDIMLENTYNNSYSILRIFDLTDPSAPVQLSQRLLSDYGAPSGFARKSFAPKGLGLAMGMSVISGIDFTHTRNWYSPPPPVSYVSQDTSAAYVANYGVGLAMVDLNLNVPEILEPIRDGGSPDPVNFPQALWSIPEHLENLGTFVSPYYRDVKVLRNKVVAVAGDNSGTGVTALEVFSLNLGTTTGMTQLPYIARELTVVENLYETANPAGGTPLQHDYAFITAMNGGLVIAEIDANGTIVSMEKFPMPVTSPPTSETRHVEVDKSKMLAYVSGKWDDGSGNVVAGVLIVNLTGTGGVVGGWDKRYIAKIPFTAPVAAHSINDVHGMKLDTRRGLLYASIEMLPSDSEQIPFAVLKLGAEAFDTATLKDATIDPASVSNNFKSDDGLFATVLATGLGTAGQVCVDVNINNTSGLPMTYTVSERSLAEGQPGYLDFARTGTTGTLNNRLCFDRKAIPDGTSPYPTMLQLDVQSGGQFVRRLFVRVTPTMLQGYNAKLTTQRDSINRTSCTNPDMVPVRFAISNDAKVTIKIDGTVLALSEVDSAGNPVTTRYDGLKFYAGMHEIEVPAPLVVGHGEHPLQITAVFNDTPDIREVFNGVINHETSTFAKLPIGHTMVKGVDIYNGQVSLSRQDIVLPAVGPGLQFSRSYSSGGSSSSGTMGAGWSHSLESRLHVGKCGTYLVGGEGSGTRFTQVPGLTPTYKPQAGYHGELIDNRNGTFDYFTKTRDKHHFIPSYDPAEATGSERVYRLDYIEDPVGNRTRLTYQTAPPYKVSEVSEEPLDTAGVLVPQAERRRLVLTYASGKTDAGGRFIGFGAVPEDRVVKVEVFKGPVSLGIALGYDYDQYGNLVSAVRDIKSETYDYTITDSGDRHNLKKVTDPNGNVTGYNWYAKADLFPGENTTQGTEILTFTDKPEFLKEILVGTGTEQTATGFVFDFSQHTDKVVTTVSTGLPHVVTVPLPQTFVTRYIMNPRGNVVETRIPGGNSDGTDNVTSTVWAFDRGIQDVYVKEQTDAAGRTSVYEYDGNANLLRETINQPVGGGYESVTDSSGAAVAAVVNSYTYDACVPTFNQVATKTDPEGNTILREINCANGLLLSEKKSSDGTNYDIVNGFTYWANGLLKTTTDANLAVTNYNSYKYSLVESTVKPGNITMTFLHDDLGRVVSSVDTAGHKTEYLDYDKLDRAHRYIRYSNDPDSPDLIESYEYYNNGEKKSVTTALGTTYFSLDSLNRAAGDSVAVSDADGVITTLTTKVGYDANGNKIYVKDRRGIEQWIDFDVMGRQTANRIINNQTGASVSLDHNKKYDYSGNLKEVSDIHGHVTSFDYDWLNRLSLTKLPNSLYSIKKTYNRVSNMLSESDQNGKTTFMAYDRVGRLIQSTDPVGRKLRKSYDPNNNVLRAEHLRPDGSIKLVERNEPYDGLNRPTKSYQEFADPVTGLNVSYRTDFTYDDAANTKRTINAARGTVFVQKYNGVDKLVESIVDEGGLNITTKYRYDGNGNLAAVIDAENGDIDLKYGYDALNRKIRTEYVMTPGETAPVLEKFFYDGEQNLVKTVTKRGLQSRTEYDFMGRKQKRYFTESITNNGNEMLLEEYGYDDVANSSFVKTANGSKTEHRYNELHQLVMTVDPLGRSITSWYDGVNKLGEIDRAGNKTEFDYDDNNRLILTREYDAAGTHLSSQKADYLDNSDSVVSYERFAAGEQPSNQTITRFDALNRSRTVTGKHSAFTGLYGAEQFLMQQTDYNETNQKVRSVNANGHVTRWVYDAADRIYQQIDADGSPESGTTTYTYDKVGNTKTVKGPRAHGGLFDASFEYDNRYRKISGTTAENMTTRYGYDQDNNLVQITKPNGHITRMGYEETGKLLYVDETDGGVGGFTRYAYDANRNRVAVQDADGNLTTSLYDSFNRVTDMYQHIVPGTISSASTRGADPGGNTATALHWHYGYDRNGNQNLIVDARGQEAFTLFDYRDRQVSRTYTNHQPGQDGQPVYPQPLSFSYSYDTRGNLLSASEVKLSALNTTRSENTTYTYDPLNRVLSKTNYDGKTIIYRYDRGGNRASVTDPDGNRTDYSYDSRERISQMSVGTATTPEITAYSYYPDGLQKKISFPNGTFQDMDFSGAYDRMGRLLSLVNHRGDSTAPISRYNYGYDANGNRQFQEEQHSSINSGQSERTSYTYDALDRLSSVSYGAEAAITYTYAPNGNRLTEKGNDPKTRNPVDRTYSYNHLNRLLSVVDAADTSQSLMYEYDANGNTVTRKIGVIDTLTNTIADNSHKTTFKFDLRDKLVFAEETGVNPVSFDYDYTGMRTRKTGVLNNVSYLYDGASLLQEYDPVSPIKAMSKKYNYGRALHSVTGSGKTSFFLLDGLNSTSEITDESASVLNTYQYDAWGGFRRELSLLVNDMTFTGKILDRETGLHYFNARYYDNTTGRFLTQDTYPGEVNKPPSLHRYLYANNNPGTYIDHDGNSATVVGTALGFAWGVGQAAGAMFNQTVMDPFVFGAHHSTWDVATNAISLIVQNTVSGFEIGASVDVGFMSGGVAFLGSQALAGAGMGGLTLYGKAEDWGKFAEDQRDNAAIGMVLGVAGKGIGMALGVAGKAVAPLVSKIGVTIMEHEATIKLTEWAIKSAEKSGKWMTESYGWVEQLGALAEKGSALAKKGSALAEKGIKAVGDFAEKHMPQSIVTSTHQEMFREYMSRNGIEEISVRAAKPWTAAGSRATADILPGKPLTEKTKSTFGILYGKSEDGSMRWLRSDYDIAWIKNTKGEFLSNSEVLKIAEDLNLMIEARGGKASVMHGAHFTSQEYYVEKYFDKFLPEVSAGKEKYLTSLEYLATSYKNIQSPGPVSVITADGMKMMSELEVKAMADNAAVEYVSSLPVLRGTISDAFKNSPLHWVWAVK